ncbi:unnamed protein product [Effrenium voratum]|nr:unnamed protein product [Effrenium voratum]
MDWGFPPSEGNFDFVPAPAESEWTEKTEKTEKKKKKKDKSSKGQAPLDSGEGWGAPEGGLEFGGITDGYRTTRRVSFSDDPPESRALDTFAPDKFAEKVGSPVDWSPATGTWMERLAADSPAERREALGAPSLPPPSTSPKSAWLQFDVPKALDAYAPDTPSEAPRPLERRFSFSLSDMAAAPLSAGSPYPSGSEPVRDRDVDQKWNPLNGIRPHWNPGAEIQPFGSFAREVRQPPSLQDSEVQRAEGRAQLLRQKIAHLESALSGGGHEGHMTITAPMCQDGLGVVLHDLTVASITEPLAERAGWAVGDSILQVNGVTVLNASQLSGEVAKALSAHRAVGRPMVFEVWRHKAPASNGLLGTPPSALQPNMFNAPHAPHAPNAWPEAFPGGYGPPPQVEPVTRSAPVPDQQPWAGPKLMPPQSWAGPQLVASSNARPDYQAYPAAPQRRRRALC